MIRITKERDNEGTRQRDNETTIPRIDVVLAFEMRYALFPMLRYLHTLSAVLFYLLGSSFFLAYILLRNRIGGTLPVLWMDIGDLPLLLSGMLYGGVSVVRSVRGEARVSALLVIAIGLPLLILFGAAAYVTFFPAVVL